MRYTVRLSGSHTLLTLSSPAPAPPASALCLQVAPEGIGKGCTNLIEKVDELLVRSPQHAELRSDAAYMFASAALDFLFKSMF